MAMLFYQRVLLECAIDRTITKQLWPCATALGSQVLNFHITAEWGVGDDKYWFGITLAETNSKKQVKIGSQSSIFRVELVVSGVLLFNSLNILITLTCFIGIVKYWLNLIGKQLFSCKK